MNREALFQEILKKKSYLCVGLDPDLQKIPPHLLQEKDPVFEFNRRIIDATIDFAVAYKPNIAFYESLGAKGWESLRRTLEYIPDDVFTIADAKRGDIGNTSAKYAHTFFKEYSFDAITLSPYMGRDSVEPFLSFPNKWVIVLALTSNPGSQDFETLLLDDGKMLFETVIRKCAGWGSTDTMMFVVGATQASQFEKIRELIPDHFLLVPGIGAQGGDLETVSKKGMNSHCGLLVNTSRSIIYAGSGKDFAENATQEASNIRRQMERFLEKHLP